MEITPEFQKKIQAKIRADVKEALTGVAKQVTNIVRHYVAQSLYKRPISPWYGDRDEEEGFLGTFADAQAASEIVDSMLRTQGNKVYLTFLLRDYDYINYEMADKKGNFNHHLTFDGEETNNSRYHSDLDDFINDGHYIRKRNGELGKFIKGIHFREFASNIVKTMGNTLLKQEMEKMGYNMDFKAGTGRKRINIPIDKIELDYE